MGLTLCFVFLTIFGILTGHVVQTWTSGLYSQGFSGAQGISGTTETQGIYVTPRTPEISVPTGPPGYAVTPGLPGYSVTPGLPGYSISPRFLGHTVIPGLSGYTGTPGLLGYTGTPGYSKTPVYPYGYINEPVCRNQITNELVSEFINAIYQTATYLFKKTATVSDNHFISSPFTTWMALAAIAEGAEDSVKQRLFLFLNLPQDRCVRQLYYKLATSVDNNPNKEVVLHRNHQFIFDSSVRLYPNWQRFVTSNNLIDITTSPFKTFPEREAEVFRSVFNAKLPNLNLNGNSIMLESLDYQGLWTMAFSDAIIETGPFYNAFGEKIGTIEYMKTRTPAYMAYLPDINLKVIELPIGSDGRYKLLIGITVNTPLVRTIVDSIKPTVVLDIFSNLRLTPTPVDVVIPRMMMTSEVDVKSLLDELNIDTIWKDPIATSNISAPSALPSSYIQRISATIDSNGVQPSIQRFSNFVPSLPQQKFNPFNTTIVPIGGDFIANKPFLFGLINTENYYLASFCGAFSKINT